MNRGLVIIAVRCWLVCVFLSRASVCCSLSYHMMVFLQSVVLSMVTD